ncbi:MAG TPA: hypothetical protein PKW42_00725 [bacterium]|nr:hypothetical protein [bacterium]
MRRKYPLFLFLIIPLSMVVSGEQDNTRNFALGVEYMVPGFAEVYARAGITWAKAMGQGFSWDDIEPRPPVKGKHSYRWDHTDRLILEYQRAGFKNFHIYVKSMNRWASSKPIACRGSSPIKPEFLDDYKAFLQALVQRYNINHPDHVPGLLYSVEYWEIEAEWGTGFWQGTLEEYIDLLRVAYPVVKKANPEAKVILIGFFLAGVFEGHPDIEQIPAVLSRLPSKLRKVCEQYLADIKKLLSYPELFDVVEFHSLSDWSEIMGMSRFLKKTMREYGYEKPVWVGDVNYTASPLVFWGQPIPPYTEKQLPAIKTTLHILANVKHPRHKEVEAWFRAEQSKGLVKKVVLAMAEGLSGINVGNMKDEKLFAVFPEITGTVAFQGIVETKGMPPGPGKPRPAYYSLRLLSQKLMNFSAVKQLNLGSGIYAYEFTVHGHTVYVLWYDDGHRYLPGDIEPSVTVEIPLPEQKYTLTETPVKEDMLNIRTVSCDRGVLKLKSGTTPVFVEPFSETAAEGKMQSGYKN